MSDITMFGAAGHFLSWGSARLRGMELELGSGSVFAQRYDFHAPAPAANVVCWSRRDRFLDPLI